MSEVESRGKAQSGEEQQDPDASDETAKPNDREASAANVEKLPDAKDIGRGEFTPHAIGAAARRTPRSGTRAEARRRRMIYTSGGTAVVVLAIAGLIVWANWPPPSVKVHGAFGKAPSVAVPKAKPAVKKQVKELIHGSGAAVGKGDIVALQLVGYRWSSSGGKLLLNSYNKGTPALGPSNRVTGLPALDNEILGRRTGSRLQLTLPYRDVGAQIAGQLQLARTDDFVLTADVVATYGKTSTAKGTPQNATDKSLPTVTAGAPGTAPTIKIPSTDPPSTLQTKTLIQGAGPAVAKGKTVVVQYHGVLWRDGKVFDSTWQRGMPFVFPVGAGQVIPAWDKGLTGQKVGSRLLLAVPPKDGYGTKGSPDGRIKGTDTLVFVVDILGSY